ncbi:MAG TPA: acylphosphatase [Naasia sp.]|jgi:acylphosphatase
MPARHVLVSGVVQGVGFRWSARTEAQRLGVAGWVRNLPDGTVEAHLEGADAAVDAMIEWLHTGPPGARVESVEVQDAAEEGAAGFHLLR